MLISSYPTLPPTVINTALLTWPVRGRFSASSFRAASSASDKQEGWLKVRKRSSKERISKDWSSARGAALRLCRTRCNGFPATPFSHPCVNSLESSSMAHATGGTKDVEGLTDGGAEDGPLHGRAPADVAGRAVDDWPKRIPLCFLMPSRRSVSSSGSSMKCSVPVPTCSAH